MARGDRVDIGDWVRIRRTVLTSAERLSHLPAATRKVPLECYINGYSLSVARRGEMIDIETPAGRRVAGTLHEINPRYTHGFGRPDPLLGRIGPLLRQLLENGEEGCS